ncbi:aminoacyl-tRNA deacylase [Candidatus Halocynthiibacter alkanivorans]|uniref:aminoacyl-tRNA deacylase n=1 Tax=Candidatus Halocynthiibacter alkanivorans TaxID=2267619 RepID=UPI000DF42282|nr:YbaK/EbsC family protein [Candidatus Halocynthiibacter alkanivorans]
MTIAARLEQHLNARGLPFDTVPHPYAATATECAEAAHVPGDHLAKSVLIHMEEGPMLAVLPSNHQVDLSALQAMMHRRLGLAAESEMRELFDDCDLGAAPAVGQAYDVRTVLDNSLTGLDKIWFEAGDHKTLVEMRGKDFDTLMQGAEHGSFCCLH